MHYKYKVKTYTVVGVYVDDLLVTGTEQSAVDNLFCRDEFTVDQGPAGDCKQISKLTNPTI